MNLAEAPRLRLMSGPTPLEECPRLSAALGGPHLWVKRDDLTGLGLGGNKVRKLEYLLGDAVRQGADVVITTGAVQSNHARLTAAACCRLGLDVALVLTRPGQRDLPPAVGNLLLDRLYGAAITVLDDDSEAAVAGALEEVAAGYVARGRRPYVIPVGGSNAVGTLGYVGCALEIARQSVDEGVFFDHLFITTGSGGTHAGLHFGAHRFLPGTTVHGVAISRAADRAAAIVDRLAAETAALLGCPESRPPALVHGGFVGEGYAIPTEAGWEAMVLAARHEGLILDPVYTGKALSGLIALIREGTFPSASKVLFVHTGGAAGFMAQAAAFEDYLVRSGGTPAHG